MTSAISNSFSSLSQLSQFIFKQADTDKDGSVTKAELEATKPQGGPTGGPSTDEFFAAGDANGDGKLTQAELEDALKKSLSNVSDETQGSLLALQEQDASDPLQDLVDALLKALDDNKDGKIDKSDIEALKKKAEEAAAQQKQAQAVQQSEQNTVTLTIQTSAEAANDNTGYTGRTATLSFLLTFQDAS
jgi:Ca2+-binding EF-hand superfamily protein